MNENLSLPIEQTMKFITEQIHNLEAENSLLTEKVIMRESQIKQTSSDLQDAYNRLIRQSREECNSHIKDILSNSEKDYFQNSEKEIQNKKKKLQEEIDNETKKIKDAQKYYKISEKYVLQFENLIKTLKEQIKSNTENLEKLQIKSINKRIQKLSENSNDKTIDEYYQKQCMKLSKIENKNAKSSVEYDQLKTVKNEIKSRITNLSNNIVDLASKISCSFHNKEVPKLVKQDFDIINIEPALQKRKNQQGNLLILAPIHSLTRQMKGTQGVSRFFLKKNLF